MGNLSISLLWTAVYLITVCPVSAESLENRLDRLDEAIRTQSETIKEQQKLINELRKQLTDQQHEQQKHVQEVKEQQKSIEEVKELQKAVLAEEPSQISQMSKKVTGLFGGTSLTNPNISVVLDVKGYVSNLKNSQLQNRGVNGYTTDGFDLKNGFNLKEAEILIFAPVDPYFNLYAMIPVGENGATLEEAYVVSTSLPEGFQVKGGRFKSNTSRLNSQHPHAWDFADIPLPYRAFLGAEGIGGDYGLQVTSLLPLQHYTLLGAEVLQGNNPLLFGPNDNKGPHAFTAFAKLSVDTGDNSTLLVGPWAMFGSTKSDKVIKDAAGAPYTLNGDSQLYGFEALWKWKEGKMGVTVQSEYLFLRQHGNVTDSTGSITNNLMKRDQDGFYVQSLYQYDLWRIGARYDRLGIFGNIFELDGINQTYGGKPWRATASLEFTPTEFTRFRAQFTHDSSSRDGRINNEGILQAIFTIGAHGAHPF